MRASVPALALAVLTAGANAQSLANPSFESSDPMSVLPTTFGVWGGDITARSTGEQGIAPADGAFMLRFVTTAPTDAPGGGGAGTGSGSDMWQLVDLTPILADVQAGGLFVWHSCEFNRVAGDSQTDTDFRVSVRAYDGPPAGFKLGPTQVAIPITANAASLISDDDTSTWEINRVKLEIPTDATFIAVSVNAVEDVFNDSTAPEFDGHYADGALLVFTRCVGDIDGDGDTDVFDFAELAAAFGSVPAGPTWSPYADLNGDDAVNVFDFSELAADFGCAP